MQPCDREPGIWLTSADEAWLRMDRPKRRTVITAVFVTAEPLPYEQVVELVSHRLVCFPRFRCVVRGRRKEGRAEPFDVRAHVLRHTLEGELAAFLGARMEEPLPLDRPLWRIHVIEEPQRTILVWRIHHALADGTSLMRVLQGIVDEPPPKKAAAPTRHRRPAFTTARLVMGGPLALARLGALPKDPPSSLKRKLSGTKRVAWSESVPVDDVKRFAKSQGATINDVLVAALAGAIRQELLCRGDRVPRQLRAILPIDLRSKRQERDLGNRLGLLFLALPIGQTTPASRLRVVQRRMSRLKRSPEAIVARRLVELVGKLSPAVTAIGTRFFARKATMMLTNVAGPKTTLEFGGVPLREIEFWIPHVGEIGLGFSILSYAGAVRMGVTADASCAAEPQRLAGFFRKELDALGVTRLTDAASGPRDDESELAGPPGLREDSPRERAAASPAPDETSPPP